MPESTPLTLEQAEGHLAALSAPEDSLPAETRQWLRQGVQSMLQRHGAVSMDAHLGLIPAPGAKSVVGQIRRKRRDSFIRTALDIELGLQDDLGTNRQEAILEAMIASFNATIWPAWADLDEPPAGASASNQALFHAAKLHGRKLPSTGAHLLGSGKKAPEETFHDSIFTPIGIAKKESRNSTEGVRSEQSYSTDPTKTELAINRASRGPGRKPHSGRTA